MQVKKIIKQSNLSAWWPVQALQLLMVASPELQLLMVASPELQLFGKGMASPELQLLMVASPELQLLMVASPSVAADYGGKSRVAAALVASPE